MKYKFFLVAFFLLITIFSLSGCVEEDLNLYNDSYYINSNSNSDVINSIYNDSNNLAQDSNDLTQDPNNLMNDLNNFSGVDENVLNVIDFDVLFCPEDPCQETFIQELSSAKQEVLFLAYSFTLDEIADVLLDLNSNGVRVFGLFEKQGITSQYSEFDRLNSSSIQVRYDSNPSLMHEKIFIIDNFIVLGGSMNHSQNAVSKNNENLTIIKNQKIASEFKNEFWELFNKGIEVE